jgi:hypothetical protein
MPPRDRPSASAPSGPRLHPLFALLAATVVVWAPGCGPREAGRLRGAQRPRAAATRVPGAEPAPGAEAEAAWGSDFAAALARGRAARRHLCVLVEPAGTVADTDSGGLADPLVRRSLEPLVRVRTPGDPLLTAALGPVAGPTLAFLNPLTEVVDHRADAGAGPERLAREIVHARRAIGMPLSPELEAVAARMFSLDAARLDEALAAGDAAAVAALLAPAAGDDSRLANYLVATVDLAEDVLPDHVRFLAGRDCVVGGFGAAATEPPAFIANRPPDLVGSCSEAVIPPSGLVVIEMPPGGEPQQVRISAPGCRLVEDVIRFAGEAPGTAVQVRHYELRPLAPGETATLRGRVLHPDGSPAADATVRLADCFLPPPEEDAVIPLPVTARTGPDGRYEIGGLSPGRFLARGEAPGGERERFVELAEGAVAECDLELAAATTVSLRWALQTRELVEDLVGPGVREGEATFSVASSRLLLATGLRTRTTDCSDIMFARAPLGDDDLPADALAELAALPAGAPVWYLRDAAYTRDFSPLSGLHRDPRGYADIRAVRDGEPLGAAEWEITGDVLPAAVAAAREAGSFFQILRGVPVRKGDVFVLRCVAVNCYAKVEVTDVTIRPDESAAP